MDCVKHNDTVGSDDGLSNLKTMDCVISDNIFMILNQTS